MHGIDVEEEDISAYLFWRLLWNLPFYDGAVKAMLRFLAEQKKIISQPAKSESVAVASVPVQAAKLPQVHPGVEREVPAEYLNVVTGENLISFGSGG